MWPKHYYGYKGEVLRKLYKRVRYIGSILVFLIPLILGARPLEDIFTQDINNPISVFCFEDCRHCRHSQGFCTLIAKKNLSLLCGKDKKQHAKCFFLWNELIDTCNELCWLP